MTARVAAVLFAVLALAASSALALQANEPSFCNNLNCPQFTVIETSGDVQVRLYPAVKWVSVNITGVNYTQAGTEAFDLLFDYISGTGNAQGVKVPMATPVPTEITPGAGPNCASTFVVSFFIDFSFQDSPPTPTNPQVYIREQPELKLVTKSFGGFADNFNSALIAQINGAYKWAQSANISVSAETYAIAQYDSPFRILDRHNEVWLYVE